MILQTIVFDKHNKDLTWKLIKKIQNHKSVMNVIKESSHLTLTSTSTKLWCKRLFFYSSLHTYIVPAKEDCWSIFLILLLFSLSRATVKHVGWLFLSTCESCPQDQAHLNPASSIFKSNTNHFLRLPTLNKTDSLAAHNITHLHIYV